MPSRPEYRRPPLTVRQAFAQRLVQLRTAHSKRVGRRLSQAGFAALLGIDSERYGSYERGGREPPLEILARLREVTGASLDDLVRK